LWACARVVLHDRHTAVALPMPCDLVVIFSDKVPTVEKFCEAQQVQIRSRGGDNLGDQFLPCCQEVVQYSCPTCVPLLTVCPILPRPLGTVTEFLVTECIFGHRRPLGGGAGDRDSDWLVPKVPEPKTLPKCKKKCTKIAK
jgi:hypothetical protein